jgi:hypothetical protein
MPAIGHLSNKLVMLQIRGGKPITATVKATDQLGVWVMGAGDLAVSSGVLKLTQIQTPMFFVPWTSVDWIVVQAE